MARKYFFVICLCPFLLPYCKTDNHANVTERPNSYQDEWVIRVEGGTHVSSLLALQTGYKNLGLVMGFKDTYLWRKDDRQRPRKRGYSRFVKALTSQSEILWADQQRIFERHKRDHVTVNLPDLEKPLVREKRLLDELEDTRVRKDRKWDQAHQETEITTMFNDELWNEEWYLQDTRTNKGLPKLDLNVLPLYRLGITGRGVRIAVLDDGLEYTHEDLRTNYDPEISYDVNDADDDPIPRYELTGMNGHGTRCAGEIAMEANNRKCGVGVAFESRVGGIKLLDGIINDRVEGEALGYKQELVDIYTASWGPADDGKSLESPGRLAAEAMERGITEGRGGKGNIYVWASGNGGSKHDDCGCDGYVGSVYTIAVGSASQTGKFPWYGERCPATFATTYSSGAYQDQMIATTDLKNRCTTRHTGTSASAPLAAGIFALALQVKDNPGWFKNSAGFWFNSRFGFGLMNAHALVISAQNWTRVPEKQICQFKPLPIVNRSLVYGDARTVTFDVDDCHVGGGWELLFLEHVQIETSIKYTLRGALQMLLTSPSGTEIAILNPRKLDDSTEGFSKWKFMSVATWGEDPRGIWTLEISDQVGPEGNEGTIEDLTLIIHGTAESPKYRVNGARVYNDEYNRIRKMNRLEPDFIDAVAQKTIDENGVKLSRKPQRMDEFLKMNWLARLLSI